MTSRSGWLDAGLAVLSTDGWGALTIDVLSERVGRSKGSFYHFFGGVPGYRTALMEHFEQLRTQTFIDQLAAMPADDGVRTLRRMTEIVGADAERTRDLEVAIRSWAGRDEQVREALERIDAARIEFLQSQCRRVVADPQVADDVGTMIYMLMIGANHLLPTPTANDQVRMWNQLVTFLEAAAPD
ncbi:TetR/AcrR family transcriptional regulator [Pseudonocardia sp. TRM90224]|uniref:TetR/AcrR family transcriptional regulator n=1 Tax=Pseudonocardia sp. TRM90224 TaxID=2812678 RepID=UPI001E495CA3|nr:TetR/AcrR family transcriptional regulator [Pseudonocardia sp. TRM90224]